MTRLIRGQLTFAQELTEAPTFARISRARGAKREGIKYERDFLAALGSDARHGVWFRWRDASGWGWCQTDGLLGHEGRVFVFECKYTWTPDAERKLTGCYLPLVETILGRPTYGIVVCKKLTPATRGTVTRTLASAMLTATNLREIPILHWMDSPGLLARPMIPTVNRQISPRTFVQVPMQ